MIPMHLVIDHEGMRLPKGTAPATVAQHLDIFSRVLGKFLVDGGVRWMHEDLYAVEIVEGICLMDLVYDDENEWLDDDEKRTLMEQLGRCQNLNDFSDLTPVQQVNAWLRDKRAAGCIILPEGQSMADRPILDMATLLVFYRKGPELAECTEAEYIQHAVLAFPDLHFKPGIEQEFRKFSEGFPVMRPKITQAASVLNDQLSSVWVQHKGNRVGIEQHLSREIGYPTSPESGTAHRDRQAMRERDATFDGHTVCCEWHVKFKPQTDRMHFHPGVPEIAGGKPLVCHFTDHFK